MKKSLVCFIVFLLVSSPIYAGWNSEVETDAMTDEQSLYIFTDNLNSMILCSEFRTLVGFQVPGGERINGDSVRYRFDNEPAERMIMLIAPGGESIVFFHETDETLNFIKKMLSRNRLLLRISTGNSYTDIEVDLIGLSAHLEPNLEFCGVKF